MTAFLDAMAAGELGDPARIHAEGMTSRAILEDARESVARWVGVRARQIVFTSGATESIATAHHGAVTRALVEERDTVVLSAVEHSSVTEHSRRTPRVVIPVDPGGRVDPSAVREAVDSRTSVVHLQWANHEVGVIQPVPDVVDAIEEQRVLVHVDAAQAGPSIPDAVASGADLVSFSAHKLGGPPGVGVLVIRRNLRIPPLILGGDQERARRGGMENIAAIVGMGAVADHLTAHGAEEGDEMRSLTAPLIEWTERTEGVELLGDRIHRVPHLVCIQLDGLEPQPVLLALDQLGIAVHSGSSCSSEAFEPSPVLAAMGIDAQRSLRISAGWTTTPGDIETVIGGLDQALGELRALRTME